MVGLEKVVSKHISMALDSPDDRENLLVKAITLKDHIENWMGWHEMMRNQLWEPHDGQT